MCDNQVARTDGLQANTRDLLVKQLALDAKVQHRQDRCDDKEHLWTPQRTDHPCDTHMRRLTVLYVVADCTWRSLTVCFPGLSTFPDVVGRDRRSTGIILVPQSQFDPE